MASPLLISEAADLLELTPKALRHYEKLGLIAPGRSENGYRVYEAGHVLRLLRIRRLQGLGLSLEQIKALLDEDDHNTGQVWRTILNMLLDQVDTQIGELAQRRDELARLLDEEDADPLAEPAPAYLQRAQEYLDQHLTGPQASLWSRERQLSSLLDNATQTAHIAALMRLLMSPQDAVSPARADVPHGADQVARRQPMLVSGLMFNRKETD